MDPEEEQLKIEERLRLVAWFNTLEMSEQRDIVCDTRHDTFLGRLEAAFFQLFG